MRHWRKHRRLSQEKAADRVGVDRTTLGRIEKGLLPYNQDFLERLADAYGCEPADLLAVDPAKIDRRLDPRETKIVRLFREVTPEVQRIIETILRTGTEG